MKLRAILLAMPLLIANAFADPSATDCQSLNDLSRDEKEVLELIEAVSEINGPIFTAAERHTGKIVVFMRNIIETPNNDLHTLPIQFLNLIASLADSADDNKLLVSMNDQVGLLNEFSRIYFEEENFLNLLDRRSRPQIEQIINTVDKVEISHKSGGKYKGEARIKLHNKKNKNIKVDFVAIGRELGMDLPMEELILENGAEILFNDRQVDHKGRYLRDKNIVDLVENATTRELQGQKLIGGNEVKRTIEFIENREYRDHHQPIYFKAKGIRVKSEYLGLGGKISQGVVMPHIDEDSNGEAPRSMYLQVKATGLLGLASIAGATVAL